MVRRKWERVRVGERGVGGGKGSRHPQILGIDPYLCCSWIRACVCVSACTELWVCALSGRVHGCDCVVCVRMHVNCGCGYAFVVEIIMFRDNIKKKYMSKILLNTHARNAHRKP